jgi:hypothetical protein
MKSLKMMIWLVVLSLMTACSPSVTTPPTPTANTKKTLDAAAAELRKTAEVDMQNTMQAEMRSIADLQKTMDAYTPPALPAPDLDEILPDIEATVEAETSGAAIRASKAALSQSTDIPKKEISLVEIESITWPDTCMGVEQSGVDCLPFMVPGFLIHLETRGEIYEYHTNLDGSTIVQKP